MVIVAIAGAIGGAINGAFGIKATAFALPSFLSIPVFFTDGTLYNWCSNRVGSSYGSYTYIWI